ncbi:MAG: response regulator [Pseudomonadota bacterium]
MDDNVDLAENIAEILTMQGYVTEIAASAEEALPKALPDGPGFMVTDFRLPGMNGADLVEKVRAIRSVRAVVISAYTDDLTVATAQGAGAHFLSKPVDFASLAQLLKT